MEKRIKIALLGNFSAGKTSLTKRYIEKSFSDTHKTTIGVKISKKEVTLPSSLTIKSVIWDIQGKTSYSNIPSKYLSGTDFGIIAIDVTSDSIIEDLKSHLSRLIEFSPKSKFIVALTKSDLDHNSSSIKELETIIKTEFNDCIEICKTSSKFDEGVEELFMLIYQQITK